MKICNIKWNNCPAKSKAYDIFHGRLISQGGAERFFLTITGVQQKSSRKGFFLDKNGGSAVKIELYL